MNDISTPVEPNLPHEDINTPFRLIEDLILSLEFQKEPNKKFEIEGNVVFNWLPKPKIYFECEKEDTGLDLLSINAGYCTINSDLFKRKIKAFITNSNSNLSGKVSLNLQPTKSFIELHSESLLSQINFSIPNFPFYEGDRLKLEHNDKKQFWSGRIRIVSKEWEIILDKIHNHQKLKKQLKDKGGYAITFGGRIKRKDGTQFSFETAKPNINKLSHLLTFVSAQKTHPLIPVGITDEGKKVDLEWTLPMIDRWNTAVDSWVDIQNPQGISKIASEYFNLLDEEPWETNIPQLLYWYTFANRNTRGAGTDGSIIIAVAALEQLAWSFLGKEQFERNQLKRNLDKVFKGLNLPKEIPDKLDSLFRFSTKEMNWQGGSSKVLSELRNEIVHPDRESKIPTDVLYEGLSLALWYFDISILSLCNYEGPYKNRTKISGFVGETDYFPIN